MIEKITHRIESQKYQLTHSVHDLSISLSVGIGTVFTLQNLVDWFVHTLGACVSAVIVSLVLYFIMRKVKKMFP